jgi:uncharacterized protein (TIGR04255 family)
MTEKYSKPPITEAVIEVRFSPPLPEKLLRKLIAQIKPRYELMEEQIEFEFQLGTDATPQIKQDFSGARFRSVDASDTVILQKNLLIVSRTPPYTGWTALVERMSAEIGVLRKFAPDRTFSRLGVRYLNRIDIPLIGDGHFTPEPYLTFYPARPVVLSGPAQGYSVAFAGCLVDDYMINVNSGITPSPLIDHAAILVDVDAYIEGPMDFKTVLERIDGVRGVKNSVFESLITDSARQTFND